MNSGIQEVYAAFIYLDKLLFFEINHEWTNPFLDMFFTYLTDFHNTKYILLALVLAWLFIGKRRALMIIVGCLLSVALADVFASRVLKPLVNRARPEYSTTNVRLLVPHQSSPSFPSSHAANSVAVAALLGIIIPKARRKVWITAGLIAYSRSYVGVHYPLDLLGGAAVGVFSATTVYGLFGNYIHTQLPAWKPTAEKIPRHRRKLNARSKS